MAGLSGILSILGGFVPVIGPGISAAGTIASGIGTFLANSNAASSDEFAAEKQFANKALILYRELLARLDDAVSALFDGKSIPVANGFNITDMMEGGAWLSPNALTNVSDLREKLKLEVISRSIDSLWKTKRHNKMWVLFVDLQDEDDYRSCLVDTTGPQDSKYCADGGVYYTYNFVEAQGEGGGNSWPWGADKLVPQAQVDLKIRSLYHQEVVCGHYSLLNICSG